MNLDSLWTAFLDLVAQIVIPTWNNLIQYIPLLLVLLLIVSIAGLAWYWQRNSAANRSRVRRSGCARCATGCGSGCGQGWARRSC